MLIFRIPQFSAGSETKPSRYDRLFGKTYFVLMQRFPTRSKANCCHLVRPMKLKLTRTDDFCIKIRTLMPGADVEDDVVSPTYVVYRPKGGNSPLYAAKEQQSHLHSSQ